MRAVIRIIAIDGRAEDHPTIAVSKAALAEVVAQWRAVYSRAEGRTVYGYAVYVD